MLKFQLHFAEGRVGMAQYMHAAEAQMPGVPHDIEKNDAARPTLGGEHPVARPGILGDITLAAKPYVKTVQRVVKNRQPNTEQLQIKNKRKAREQLDLLGISGGTSGSEGVRDEISIRNAPTGIMPLRECSLRSTNECPCAAPKGGTPLGTPAEAVGLAVVATGPLVKLGDD